MPLYRLGHRSPSIHPDAYVSPDAVIIGNVTIGAEASVWPGAVLRGDHGTIEIGAQTSIQDGTVIHCGPGFPTIVGARCVVGHMVHLEGCILKDDSLVGSGSVVLHHAVVGSWSIVGANAVVPNRTQIPPDSMALGVPVSIKEGTTNRPLIEHSAAQYVLNARLFRDELVRIDGE